MVVSKLSKLVREGQKQLEEATADAASAEGPSSLLGKVVQAGLEGQRRVERMHRKVAAAAGEQLNRVTGDQKAADRAAARIDQVNQGFRRGIETARAAYDQVAETTAQKLSDATGRDTSARHVKVATAVGVAVVAGTADGLVDVGGEEALEGMDGPSAEATAESAPEGTADAPRPEIDFSQNGTVVSDGSTTYASAGGVTVKG